ncbi:helix-turn-helix domain-containing protein, partial [bacterium]|nr:helix-turn-helix domain-containing protein [bacterium]
MAQNSEKKFISLKEASELCSYSEPHLRLRAREGKLKAVKIGRNWATTKEWLDEFLRKTLQDKRKQQIQKEKEPTQTQKSTGLKHISTPPLLTTKTSILLSAPTLLPLIFFIAFLFAYTFANPQPFLSFLQSTFTPFSHSLSSLKDELQPSSFSFLLSSLKSSFDPSFAFSTFLEDTKYLTQKETNYLSLSNFSSLLSPSQPIKKGEIKDYFSFIGQFLKSKANTLLSLIWPEKFLKEEQLKP